MEILNDYAWIGIPIILGWFCYRLWKAGKYRDPEQENIYFNIKKRKDEEDKT